MIRISRGFTAALLTLGLLPGLAPFAQAAPVTEIVYNSIVDPNNKSDPRAQAQAETIDEFQRRFPSVHVQVFTDNTGANAARTVRTHATSPDVLSVPTYLIREYVQAGGLLPLDELISRDKVDMTDWLLPVD